MPSNALPLLSAHDLVTGYGKRQVVNGISIDVASDEIVALIGHNGAGKTTLLKALFGLLPLWRGAVFLNGHRLGTIYPRELLRGGVAYVPVAHVPQGGRVFCNLTVRENLEMGGVSLDNKARLDDDVERVLNIFPQLKSRLRQRAGTLSGGEKQMLALANALILAPRLLLLDEPSLGLAPQLVVEALGRIKSISQDNRSAVLIVEQKVRDVLKIARRVYVLRSGIIAYSGFSEELMDESKLREVYL